MYFVTRLKDDASCGIAKQREVRVGGNLIRDEEILLTKTQEEGPEAVVRRIEVWVEEKQKTMVFLTNHLKLAVYFAATFLGHKMKLRILCEKLLVISQWFFGIPLFRFYALADGIKTILAQTSPNSPREMTPSLQMELFVGYAA